MTSSTLTQNEVKAQHDFLDAGKVFDWRRVFDVVTQKPTFLNCQPANRYTVLHQASFCGDDWCVNELLLLRADPCLIASSAISLLFSSKISLPRS